MWDLISLTRGQTHAPCSGSAVLTTGPPGKSGIFLLMFLRIYRSFHGRFWSLSALESFILLPLHCIFSIYAIFKTINAIEVFTCNKTHHFNCTFLSYNFIYPCNCHHSQDMGHFHHSSNWPCVLSQSTNTFPRP